MSRRFRANKNIPPSTTYPGRVTRNNRYPPTTVTAPSTGSGSTTTESNHHEDNPFVSASTMFRTPPTTTQQGIRPAPEGALPPRTTTSTTHSSSTAQTSRGTVVSSNVTLGASSSHEGQPDPIYTTAGGTSGQSSSGSRNSSQQLADAIYMTTMMNSNTNRQNETGGEPQQQNSRNESAHVIEPPNDLLIDLGENLGNLSNQQSNRNSTAQTTRSLLDEPEPPRSTSNASNQHTSRNTATQASRSLLDETEPPRYRTLPPGPRSRNEYGEPPPGYDEAYRTPPHNRYARNDSTPYGRNAYGGRARQGYNGTSGRMYNGNQYAGSTYREYMPPRGYREREPRYEERQRDREQRYYGGPSQRDLDRGSVYQPESNRRQGSNTRQENRETEPSQQTSAQERSGQSQVTVEYALGQDQNGTEVSNGANRHQERRDPEPPRQESAPSHPPQAQVTAESAPTQRQNTAAVNTNVTPNVSPIPLPPPEMQQGVLQTAPAPIMEDTSEIPIPRDMIEKFRDCMAYIGDRAGDGRTGQACRGASVALQDYLTTSRENNEMVQQERSEQDSRSVDEYTRNWNRDIQEAARERGCLETAQNQVGQSRRNSTPCEEELTPAARTGVKMPSTRRGPQAAEPATQNVQTESRRGMSVRIQEPIEADEPEYYVRPNPGGPMLRCTFEPRAGALTAPTMEGLEQQRRDPEKERRDRRDDPPQRSNQRQETEPECSQDAARTRGNTTGNQGARSRGPHTPTTTYYSGTTAQEAQRGNGSGRSREENADWAQRVTDEDVGDVANEMNVPFESIQQRAEVAYLIRELMQERHANRGNRTEEGTRATREAASGNDPEPTPPTAEATTDENARNRPPRTGANRKSNFKDALIYRGDDSISLQKWRKSMENNFLYDGVVDDIERGSMALTKLGGDAEDTISNEMLDKGIKYPGYKWIVDKLKCEFDEEKDFLTRMAEFARIIQGKDQDVAHYARELLGYWVLYIKESEVDKQDCKYLKDQFLTGLDPLIKLQVAGQQTKLTANEIIHVAKRIDKQEKINKGKMRSVKALEIQEEDTTSGPRTIKTMKAQPLTASDVRAIVKKTVGAWGEDERTTAPLANTCAACGEDGHELMDCTRIKQMAIMAAQEQQQLAEVEAFAADPGKACYNCGDPDHFSRNCPKPRKPYLKQGEARPTSQPTNVNQQEDKVQSAEIAEKIYQRLVSEYMAPLKLSETRPAPQPNGPVICTYCQGTDHTIQICQLRAKNDAPLRPPPATYPSAWGQVIGGAVVPTPPYLPLNQPPATPGYWDQLRQAYGGPQWGPYPQAGVPPVYRYFNECPPYQLDSLWPTQQLMDDKKINEAKRETREEERALRQMHDTAAARGRSSEQGGPTRREIPASRSRTPPPNRSTSYRDLSSPTRSPSGGSRRELSPSPRAVAGNQRNLSPTPSRRQRYQSPTRQTPTRNANTAAAWIPNATVRQGRVKSTVDSNTAAAEHQGETRSQGRKIGFANAGFAQQESRREEVLQENAEAVETRVKSFQPRMFLSTMPTFSEPRHSPEELIATRERRAEEMWDSFVTDRTIPDQYQQNRVNVVSFEEKMNMFRGKKEWKKEPDKKPRLVDLTDEPYLNRKILDAETKRKILEADRKVEMSRRRRMEAYPLQVIHDDEDPEMDPSDYKESATANTMGAEGCRDNDKGRFYVAVGIHDDACMGLVDTGSELTIMNAKIFQQFFSERYHLQRMDVNCVGIDAGKSYKFQGYFNLPMTVMGEQRVERVCVLDNLACALLLGHDFLAAFKFIIDYYFWEIRTPSGIVQTYTKRHDREKGAMLMNSIAFCRSVHQIKVPPLMGKFVVVSVPEAYRGLKQLVTEPYCQEGNPGQELLVPAAVSSIREGETILAVTNMSNHDVIIDRHQPLASVELAEIAMTVVDEEEAKITATALDVTLEGSQATPSLATEDVSRDDLEADVEEVVARLKEQETTTQIEKEGLIELPGGISLESSGMSTEQKQEMTALLWIMKDVFVTSDLELGRTDIIDHHIPVTCDKPQQQPPHRIPCAWRDESKKAIKEMLEADVIQPSKSPWASPVVMVKKKNGKLRFCVDYRKLNSVSPRDNFPLPRIDETLQQMGGAAWFTGLDLQAGYWQVPVYGPDRPKTAFITSDGLFEYKKMPFGLNNAPATFQRMMQMVLAGMLMEFCLCYLDDVIIFSRDFKTHLHDVAKVLNRIREAGLKIKGSKCEIAKNQVKFLGHIVSGEGIAADPEKTEAIQNCPIPKSVTQVRSFLGLAGFYRHFIKGYSEIASPMFELLNNKSTKEMKFRWSEEANTAFEVLKKAMVSAPVLGYPETEKPFWLYTDASQKAIGNVLAQKTEEGLEFVIAYGSKKLQSAETRYSTTERECLAITRGMEQYKHFLLGNFTTIITDHLPLVQILNKNRPATQLTPRLFKLSLKIEGYDYLVVYKAGKKHKNADAMSRTPFVRGIDDEEALFLETFSEALEECYVNEDGLLIHEGYVVDDPAAGRCLPRWADEMEDSDDEGLHEMYDGLKAEVEEFKQAGLDVVTRSMTKEGNSLEEQLRDMVMSAPEQEEATDGPDEREIEPDETEDQREDEEMGRIPRVVVTKPQSEMGDGPPKVDENGVEEDTDQAARRIENTEPERRREPMFEPNELRVEHKDENEDRRKKKMRKIRDENPGEDFPTYEEIFDVQPPWDPEEIQRAQEEDPELGPLAYYVKHGRFPDGVTDSQRQWAIEREHQYVIYKDILYHAERRLRPPKGEPLEFRLVVPQVLREGIMTQHHHWKYGSHMGPMAVWQKIRRRFHWPLMQRDVRLFLERCPVCARYQRQVKNKQPMRPIRPVAPFHMVGIDVMGPFPPTDQGNRHILCVIDYFTKWPEAYSIPDQTSKTVLRNFIDGFVCRHGVPAVILSDNGPCFTSREFKLECQNLGIRGITTSPYHQQANGLVERWNQTLKAMVVKNAETTPAKWDEYVQPACFAYRTSVHASTRETPFYLLYGRDPSLPGDNVLAGAQERFESTDEYKDHLVTKLKIAWKEAARQVEQAQEAYKKYYDKSAKLRQLTVGDLVLLKNFRGQLGALGWNKFHPNFDKLYRVMSIRSNNRVGLQRVGVPNGEWRWDTMENIRRFGGFTRDYTDYEKKLLPRRRDRTGTRADYTCGRCRNMLAWDEQQGLERTWIGCDRCQGWFHLDCEGLAEVPDEDVWYCGGCAPTDIRQREVGTLSKEETPRPSEWFPDTDNLVLMLDQGGN